MKKFLVLVLLVAGVNAQCDYSSESLCENNENCSWFEDIETGNCSDIMNGSECYQTNQCSWYSAGSYGYWYDNCYGGTYEIDNSYCGEILMPECYELNENTCNHPLYGEGCEWIDGPSDCGNINSELSCSDNGCEWVEDVESGSCSSLSSNECSSTPGCDWEYGCIQWGWWYDWCYTYGYECTGGTYQVDNSYCDGETGYCQDASMLGDVNGDSVINVLDVVQIVNSILNSESYNHIADINNDASVDVLDVIEIINMIINGD